MTQPPPPDGPMPVVPMARESEEALIGSVLINPGVFWNIVLEPDEFYIYRHRWIWQAFNDIRQSAQEIDIVTLIEYLDRAGHLEEIGGAAYLTQLINSVPSSLNAGDYAAHVRNAANRRQALEYANQLAKAAYDEQNDIISERAHIAQKLTDVQSVEGAVHISKWMSDVYDKIHEWDKNPKELSGLSTGFVDVDKVLGDGLLTGVNLIGGAPGKGKSILVQNIAENLVNEKITGVLYTPELRKLHFSLRVLSKNTGVPVSRYYRGQVEDGEWTTVVNEIERISQLPFFVLDPRRITTGEFRADVTRLKIQHDIKWVAFDYLELFADRFPRIDKWERSERLIRELIYISSELDLPFLVVQKLAKSGWGNAPSMEDFSGGSDVLYDVTSASILCDHIAKDGEMPSENMRTLVSVKPQRLVEQTLTACNLFKKPLVPAFENAEKPGGMYPR